MPAIPIIMPQMGESIAEASIVSFLVKPGEAVEADQDIIEVETNKATLNVAAPCRGARPDQLPGLAVRQRPAIPRSPFL